ncbi:MAG TPA: hypothetical protein VGC53_01385 [Vicinamibacteria bacterium]
MKNWSWHMAFPCCHSNCNCEADSPDDFCGIFCRDRATVERADGSEGELACGCGHSDCYRDADSSLSLEFED